MKAAATLKQLIWLLLIGLFFGGLSYWLVVTFRRSVSWRTFVVQSGSMEPAIMTGDVVVIKKFQEYQKADVITFKDSSERTVTHRIVEETGGSGDTGETTTQSGDQKTIQSFITKGDANQTNDPESIPQEKIIGKVTMTIPKFGYVIQFIKSPWGFILCIIVPSTLILYDEIKSIFHELQKGRSRRS